MNQASESQPVKPIPPTLASVANRAQMAVSTLKSTRCGTGDSPGASSCGILLVDQPAWLPAAIGHRLGSTGVTVMTAQGLAQARLALSSGPFDLVVVHIAENRSGLLLVEELTGRRTTPGTCAADEAKCALILTGPIDAVSAIQAMRLGVSDCIESDTAETETIQRLAGALEKQQARRRSEKRVERLRRLCKDLNQARDQISQQVNLLCKDLVLAYQELSLQMQDAVQAGEFKAVIRSELDLEQLIRKSLEYILDKVGPTNAAVFLPSTGDEYSVGGYVHYDWGDTPCDLLLEHLADHLAPKLAKETSLVHLKEARQLQQWTDSRGEFLKDSHLLAIPCRHENETLALLAFFRHKSQPFDAGHEAMLQVIAPALAASLARVIRVHHRNLKLND